MRICIAALLSLLCVTARADDGFQWAVTDTPGFSWAITERGGGDPESTVTVTPGSGGERPALLAPELSLRSAIAAYRQSGGAPWYVGGGQTSQQHLANEHGWSSAQVAGLTQSELNYLHGASHTGRLNPSSFRRTVRKASSTDSYAVTLRNDGKWWWHDGERWRWTKSNLIDGMNFTGNGGSFNYSNGRMYPAPPKMAVNIAPKGHYELRRGQCVNGVCPTYRVWVND